ncbi:unnamed protein product [Eruca vesicaria subsp. sativa]|uniref:Uncharacterized protein n=1 Tax=Eruca vesicaria subsp. sativa TaxID=29727 RepID=A0ABC8JX05_ERUVS|nr:unnamed protein product [Eruca vesicaria subsp. sativa]
MATDEPSLARWSFLFGRKKLPEESQESNPEDGSSSNKEEGSQVVTNSAQEGNTGLANGIREKSKKSMFPPFESAETRALAESLSRQIILCTSCNFFLSLIGLCDIIRGNPNVKWESIKGLENAKRLLKEAVVIHIEYPSLPSLYAAHIKKRTGRVVLLNYIGGHQFKNCSIASACWSSQLTRECLVLLENSNVFVGVSESEYRWNTDETEAFVAFAKVYSCF